MSQFIILPKPSNCFSAKSVDNLMKTDGVPHKIKNNNSNYVQDNTFPIPAPGTVYTIDASIGNKKLSKPQDFMKSDSHFHQLWTVEDDSKVQGVQHCLLPIQIVKDKGSISTPGSMMFDTHLYLTNTKPLLSGAGNSNSPQQRTIMIDSPSNKMSCYASSIPVSSAINKVNQPKNISVNHQSALQENASCVNFNNQNINVFPSGKMTFTLIYNGKVRLESTVENCAPMTIYQSDSLPNAETSIGAKKVCETQIVNPTILAPKTELPSIGGTKPDYVTQNNPYLIEFDKQQRKFVIFPECAKTVSSSSLCNFDVSEVSGCNNPQYYSSEIKYKRGKRKLFNWNNSKWTKQPLTKSRKTTPNDVMPMRSVFTGDSSNSDHVRESDMCLKINSVFSLADIDDKSGIFDPFVQTTVNDRNASFPSTNNTFKSNHWDVLPCAQPSTNKIFSEKCETHKNIHPSIQMSSVSSQFAGEKLCCNSTNISLARKNTDGKAADNQSVNHLNNINKSTNAPKITSCFCESVANEQLQREEDETYVVLHPRCFVKLTDISKNLDGQKSVNIKERKWLRLYKHRFRKVYKKWEDTVKYEETYVIKCNDPLQMKVKQVPPKDTIIMEICSACENNKDPKKYCICVNCVSSRAFSTHPCIGNVTSRALSDSQNVSVKVVHAKLLSILKEFSCRNNKKYVKFTDHQKQIRHALLLSKKDPMAIKNNHERLMKDFKLLVVNGQYYMLDAEHYFELCENVSNSIKPMATLISKEVKSSLNPHKSLSSILKDSALQTSIPVKIPTESVNGRQKYHNHQNVTPPLENLPQINHVLPNNVCQKQGKSTLGNIDTIYKDYCNGGDVNPAKGVHISDVNSTQNVSTAATKNKNVRKNTDAVVNTSSDYKLNTAINNDNPVQVKSEPMTTGYGDEPDSEEYCDNCINHNEIKKEPMHDLDVKQEYDNSISPLQSPKNETKENTDDDDIDLSSLKGIERIWKLKEILKKKEDALELLRNSQSSISEVVMGNKVIS